MKTTNIWNHHLVVVGEGFFVGKMVVFLFFFLLVDFFFARRMGSVLFEGLCFKKYRVSKKLEKTEVESLGFEKTGVKPGTEKKIEPSGPKKTGDHLSQENNLLTIPACWFFNRNPYNGL